MKQVFITLLCLAIGGVAANAQEKAQPAPQVQTQKPVDPDAGRFSFKEETHDYGEVPEGPIAECAFEFKNTGKKPISIVDAHGSCGCTVPEWPHDLIMPGSSAKIVVKYTTAGHQGAISKDVTINSNARQSPMVLHIKGTVVPKREEVVQPATVKK